MKSKLIIPALCIAVFVIMGHHFQRGGQEPLQKQKSSQTIGSTEQRPAETQLKEATADIDFRLEQARKRAAAKANKNFSRSVYEGAFNSRKPEYARLFDKWQIDDRAASSALEIIRQRFLAEADASVAFFKDYENKNRHAEAQMNKIVENELAGQQLTQLLGPNRYRELADMEGKMEMGAKMKMRHNLAD
ncbi:MAG: hypothetical protein B7Z37_16795 [Verrucomicrobia bacterium 12-59-8]|nr:MAG: hypothetical protein B7Z37_16795 [Verrucomicrobia bacterium 12-59-8]